MNVKPIKLVVDCGKSVIVTVPKMCLKNGCHLNLCFILKCENLEEYRKITGIEIVKIQNGENGKVYILEDNKANVFYADLLLLRYDYRLRFGNNGATDKDGKGGLGHFLNLNTPCCARPYDPANSQNFNEDEEEDDKIVV